jgi:hypothetical protein
MLRTAHAEKNAKWSHVEDSRVLQKVAVPFKNDWIQCFVLGQALLANSCLVVFEFDMLIKNIMERRKCIGLHHIDGVRMQQLNNPLMSVVMRDKQVFNPLSKHLSLKSHINFSQNPNSQFSHSPQFGFLNVRQYKSTRRFLCLTEIDDTDFLGIFYGLLKSYSSLTT